MPDETQRPKPTIDERLEALVQTVELLAIENREIAGKLDTLTGHIDRLTTAMTTLAEAMTNHEHRIQRLEERK
jgi:hypothetical protein